MSRVARRQRRTPGGDDAGDLRIADLDRPPGLPPPRGDGGGLLRGGSLERQNAPFEVIFQEAIERILELPTAAPLGEDLQAESRSRTPSPPSSESTPAADRRAMRSRSDSTSRRISAERTFVSRTITSRTLRAGPPRRAAPGDPRRGRSRRSGPGSRLPSGFLASLSPLVALRRICPHLLLRAAAHGAAARRCKPRLRHHHRDLRTSNWAIACLQAI